MECELLSEQENIRASEIGTMFELCKPQLGI